MSREGQPALGGLGGFDGSHRLVSVSPRGALLRARTDFCLLVWLLLLSSVTDADAVGLCQALSRYGPSSR